MKRIIMPIVIGIVLILFIGLWPDKKNTDLKKITVSEVAHSIFYAPMYVAKNKGYFEEYNLDVEFILGNGADKVTAGVLSGDVEIGFCGSESTLYIYEQKEKDYLVNFAGLTKKDGSFIVSRNKDEKFKVSNLKGKHIIAGREGGMPAMTLEWTLSENGIKKSDLNFDTSVAFAAMSGAFIGGTGDYVALFEPTASELEKNGYGKIVASLGELGGVVPYTSFIAKKSYIENNKDVIKNFTKAINKGLDFVHKHTSIEIAEAIQPDFSETNITTLSNIIERYMNIDAWFTTTYINEKDFKHVEEIVKNSGYLKNTGYYKILVDNTFNK